MNAQLLALPASSLQLTVEDRVRKLLTAFETQFGITFSEITDREADLRSELGNDLTKHWFYLEVPGMLTAKGRQRVRFYAVIS
jgi:hypothetical protein